MQHPAHARRTVLGTSVGSYQGIDSNRHVLQEATSWHALCQGAPSMMPDLDLQYLPPEHLYPLDAAQTKALIGRWIEGGFRVARRLQDPDRCILLLETVRRPSPRREREVLRRATLGGSGKLIAMELGLSFSTVSHHLTQGLRRRGLASRGELLAITAIAEHVVSPAETSATHGITSLQIQEEVRFVAWFPLPASEHASRLTPAERAVVAAALAGNTNAEIARQRGASPNTIANQLSSAYRKLKVGSRWELGGAPSEVARL